MAIAVVPLAVDRLHAAGLPGPRFARRATRRRPSRVIAAVAVLVFVLWFGREAAYGSLRSQSRHSDIGT